MASTPRRNEAIEEVARLRLNQANLTSSITWAWGSGIALVVSFIISPLHSDWRVVASGLRAALVVLMILSLLCAMLFYWNSKKEKKLTKQQIKLFGLSESNLVQPERPALTKTSAMVPTGAEADMR
jgi:hypothetical protein